MNHDRRSKPIARELFFEGHKEGFHVEPKSPFEFVGVRNYFLRPSAVTVYLKSKENPWYLEKLRGNQ